MVEDEDTVHIMHDIIDMQNWGKKQIGEEMQNIGTQMQVLHDEGSDKRLLSILLWWWNMDHNDGMDMVM